MAELAYMPQSQAKKTLMAYSRILTDRIELIRSKISTVPKNGHRQKILLWVFGEKYEVEIEILETTNSVCTATFFQPTKIFRELLLELSEADRIGRGMGPYAISAVEFGDGQQNPSFQSVDTNNIRRDSKGEPHWYRSGPDVEIFFSELDGVVSYFSIANKSVFIEWEKNKCIRFFNIEEGQNRRLQKEATLLIPKKDARRLAIRRAVFLVNHSVIIPEKFRKSILFQLTEPLKI